MAGGGRLEGVVEALGGGGLVDGGGFAQKGCLVIGCGVVLETGHNSKGVEKVAFYGRGVSVEEGGAEVGVEVVGFEDVVGRLARFEVDGVDVVHICVCRVGGVIWGFIVAVNEGVFEVFALRGLGPGEILAKRRGVFVGGGVRLCG